ncbi:hypothetical protein TorRG33x02_348890, partial [Trema orientale]
LRNHVDSHFLEDSDDDSLTPKTGLVTAIDGQQLPSHVDARMEGSRLMDDKSHDQGSDFKVLGAHGFDLNAINQMHGAHGIDMNATNQKQGAHGLVREEARVSSIKEQGVHGLVGEAARVSTPKQKQGPDDQGLRGAAASVFGGGVYL